MRSIDPAVTRASWRSGGRGCGGRCPRRPPWRPRCVGLCVSHGGETHYTRASWRSGGRGCGGRGAPGVHHGVPAARWDLGVGLDLGLCVSHGGETHYNKYTDRAGVLLPWQGERELVGEAAAVNMNEEGVSS
eukprot:7388326-Prymnesium_polylepis.1